MAKAICFDNTRRYLQTSKAEVSVVSWLMILTAGRDITNNSGRLYDMG
jgi:hypothetical protein